MPKKQSAKNMGSDEVRPTYVNITISIPVSFILLFDRESRRLGYTRSEAIRMGMRQIVEVWTGRRL